MNFIPKVNVTENENEETGEVEQNFVYSDDEDDLLINAPGEVVTEEEVVEEEVVEDVATHEDDIFVEEIVKKKPKINKNGRERKPMSEEHKLKLKVAREKAVLVKKQKAEQRKVNKANDIEQKKKQKIADDEERSIAQEEKQLMKLKRQRELEKLKKEVLEPEPAPAPVAPQIIKEIIKEPTFTLADIERAQLNAIMASEKLRLQRKDEKRKKQAEEAEFDRLKQRLMKAQNPRNNFNSSRGFF